MNLSQRKHLTFKEKVKIIQKLEAGLKQSALAEEYHINKSIVSRIWKEKNKILTAHSSMPGITAKIKSTKHSDLVEKLILWFREARDAGLPISGQILLSEANKIAQNLDKINFECSLGWIDRFKKRHNITSAVISGEMKSVDSTVVKNWLDNEWPKIREGYNNEDIFNADETGLFFKCTPARTLNFKGENCSGGKLSKERVSVLLCASSTGQKLQPLIIGKYAKPRCFKNANLNEFDYASNKKAWMTSFIFKSQLNKWDSYFRKSNRKIILLIDNCSSHPNINYLTNIKLIFFPPNVTSVLQPCDQGIIKNFKHHYRKMIATKIIQAFDLKKSFNISLLDALHFIKQSWNEVKVETIVNSFCHSKIINKSETLTSAEDENVIFQILENHARELFKSKEDIIAFLNVDENVINTEELVEEKEDEDILLESEKLVQIPSLLEAIEAADLLKSFFLNSDIQHDIYPSLCKIERFLDNKYLNHKKYQQKTILDYFDYNKS